MENGNQGLVEIVEGLPMIIIIKQEQKYVPRQHIKHLIQPRDYRPGPVYIDYYPRDMPEPGDELYL
jgi:hypothetical protein